MSLVSVPRSSLPRRSAGQTSLPEEERASLLALVAEGQAASNGASYPDSKAAAQAAGPYARFLRAQVKAGNAAGKVRATTFVTKRDKDGDPTAFGWAVSLDVE